MAFILIMMMVMLLILMIMMLIMIAILTKVLIKNPSRALLTLVSTSIYVLDNLGPSDFRDKVSNHLENALKNETICINLWRVVLDHASISSNIDVDQFNIAVEYNTTISVNKELKKYLNLRIYKKKTYNKLERQVNLGVLVWFHGGGWVLGSVDGYDNTCSEFSMMTNLVVVSVEYSLAPERPFPAAIEDALIALSWVKDHIVSFGGNPNSIFLGGDSAGGNIAASVMTTLLNDDDDDDVFRSTLFPSSVLFRDLHASIVKGLVLYYPSLDSCVDRSCWGSYEEYEHDLILPLSRMIWFRKMYQNHYPLSESSQHVFAPLHTPPHLLRLFPETLILVGGKDILRDENLAFASKLIKEGVPTRVELYNYSLHAFLQLDLHGSREKSIRFVSEQLQRIQLHHQSKSEVEKCLIT